MARFRKAQTGEQRRGTGARTVAVDGLETLMQFREMFARDAGIPLSVGERALHRAQLGIAVEHEFDCGDRRGDGLLRDVPDDPGRRHRHLTRIGIDLAAQQREQ